MKPEEYQQALAIQLSHNSIYGQDDEDVLKNFMVNWKVLNIKSILV